MKSEVWAAAIVVVAVAFAGCLEQSENAMDISEDMPGIYEPVSNGEVSLLITDIHRYTSIERSAMSKGDLLTIGFVIRNDQRSTSALIDPQFFQLVDSNGQRHFNIPDTIRALKNPLEVTELMPGELTCGAIAFEIPKKAAPEMLRLEKPGALSLAVRMNKKATPPGNLYSIDDPIQVKNWIIAITGISESPKSNDKLLRIEYTLKNSGSRIASLEDRSYGKFADIIDSRGMSYSAYSYKIQNPITQPGGVISGFMTYVIPKDAVPGYLIFWPPDEDAITFDLRKYYP